MPLRKWVLRLHLYGALLCSSYLILFGVSSLMFNHPMAFTEPKEAVKSWEQTWSIGKLVDDQAEAEAVREGLGLIGWAYETGRDPDGSLHFHLSRPGKDYRIHVLHSRGLVRVEQTTQGFWQIVRGLHGLSGVPGSRLMAAWGMYTDICTFAVLFAAGSGIYLWAGRKARHAIGWALLGGAAAASVFLMIYVRIHG